MRWMKWYTVLIIFLLGAYVFAVYKKPVAINWQKTLSNRDKIPYGTYIIYKELRAIMGKVPKETRVPVYEIVNESADSGVAYILVNNEMRTTNTDEIELLNYIGHGNTVFISTEELSKSFSDSLGLSLENFYFAELNGDSTSINFASPALRNEQDFQMPKHTIDGYFKKFDTVNTLVLGMNNHGKVNFIRMDIGNGHLYLHAVPMVFTNYFLLLGNNRVYLEKMLSYLPGDAENIYWDEYYKIGRGVPSTPLRVILAKPELKWAYLTGLLTIIIFMIFQSKRRQRIIPVISPTVNNTVDFVETVSYVYLNDRNHRNIALKKLTYLFEHIRSRHYLNTLIIDDEFAGKLAHKSGMPLADTKGLIALIQFVRMEEKISDQHLIRLNDLIEEFHKYSPR
jgi:hypothetical protein